MGSKESLEGKDLESRLEGRVLLEHLLDKINQCQQDLEAAQKTWNRAKTVAEQARKGGQSFDIEQEAKDYLEGYLDKIFALGPQTLAERISFQNSIKKAFDEYDWQELKQILSKLKEQFLE